MPADYMKPSWPLQAPNYIAMVYDELDKYLLGGTQWGWTDNWTPANHDGWNQENFSITDQRRQIRSNYAIRAYPQAIAGTPGTFKVACCPSSRSPSVWLSLESPLMLSCSFHWLDP